MAITSPTIGSRSVGRVRSRTQTMGFFYFAFHQTHLSPAIKGNRFLSRLNEIWITEHYRLISYSEPVLISSRAIKFHIANVMAPKVQLTFKAVSIYKKCFMISDLALLLMGCCSHYANGKCCNVPWSVLCECSSKVFCASVLVKCFLRVF
jgi:hypothetical protein